MIQLYSADGCPYAQRVRALLTHLQVPFDLHEIDLKNKPKQFLELSPTGRVPLLVDGDHKLYESFVLLQYVAEKSRFTQAFSSDVGLRARQRLAMIQFDGVISPAVMKALREAKYEPTELVERELDELEETVRRTGSGPSLLAFHLAPFWLRWGWVRPHIPLLASFDRRTDLKRWLDEAVAMAPVQKTQPDRAATVKLYLERFGPQPAATAP
ncbi:MAG: glutathione S-transferase family protein [Myxococcaceae bacterium]|nr:glutathione S-transferase family protein [Myxococcaceae bacterium]